MLFLIKIASSTLPNQMTRNDDLFDEHNAYPAPRTGILPDPSNGEFTRDSEDDSACDGMLEINKAFKRIDDVMTSLQERSLDSIMTSDGRDELILDLSRSLWNLHMARHYIGKIGRKIISQTWIRPHVALRLLYLTNMLQQTKRRIEGLWFQ